MLLRTDYILLYFFAGPWLAPVDFPCQKINKLKKRVKYIYDAKAFSFRFYFQVFHLQTLKRLSNLGAVINLLSPELFFKF